MKRLAIAVTVVFVVLAGCSSTMPPLKGEKDLRDEVMDLAFWDDVRETAQLTGGKGEAPAVCWLSDGRTTITYDSGNFTTTDSRRVKLVVLDAKRAEPYLNITIPTSDTHAVSGIRARTILKDGTWVDLRPEDIHERSRFPDYVLYADQKEKVFAMPAVEDECVVEYEYKRSSAGADFEDYFTFDRLVPVRRASYSFAMPADLVNHGVNVSTRAYGTAPLAEHGSMLTAEGQLTSLTWTRENVPAIKVESYMPALDDVTTRIAVGLSDIPTVGHYTWEVMGRDYFDTVLRPLISKRLEGLPSTAIKWCGDAKTASEKVEAVGNAVAQRIRYVSVELEDSGWVPQRPVSTVNARYGDCKDMSILTVAMLHSLGVPAWPALLATRSSGTVDQGLVTPAVMNHMIVYAHTGDGDLWVDPTAGTFELGELPSEDRGVLALVLTDDGCYFKTTPVSSVGANRIEKRVTGKLNADGSLTASLVFEYTGDIALSTRGFLEGLSEKEGEERLEHLLRGAFGDARVTSWRCVTDGDPRPCRIIAEFESDDFAQRSGGTLIIDGAAFGPSHVEGDLPDETRWNDVVFDHAYTSTQSVEIELPDGWRVNTKPRDVNYDTDYGTFTSETSSEEGLFRSTRSFRLAQSRVKSTMYGRLLAFLDDVDGVEAEPVVLGRG
jgi:transglutaminase-like putative cysteine protease